MEGGIEHAPTMVPMQYGVFKRMMTARPMNWKLLSPEARTRSLSAHWGTSATPIPNMRAEQTMKRLRRTWISGPSISMPDTMMLQKRKVVMPPSTLYGIVLMMAEILAMTPKTIRKMQLCQCVCVCARACECV